MKAFSGTHISHSVEKYKKRDHAQKFPWNQLFSNFFSNNVDLTEKGWFFRKKSDRDFGDFSTHTVEIAEFYCHDFSAKIPSN